MTIKRYSDEDLKEFQVVVNKATTKSKKQIEGLERQLLEMTESTDESFGTDIMEDGSISEQTEFLNKMIHRQKKHLTDLELANLRIQNKTYGVCVVTNELIDKRRLLAVPTTTKSVKAKLALANQKNKPSTEKTKSTKTATKPKVLTKVIKKSNGVVAPKKMVEEEDEEDLLNDLDIIPVEEIDLDAIESDDSYEDAGEQEDFDYK